MNTAKLIVALAVAACVVGPVQAEEPAPHYKLEHATVKEVNRAPFGSGVLMIFHRVVVSTREGESEELFSLSMSANEALPAPGDVCTFDYHVGYVEITLGRSYTSGDGQIIDRFTCEPAA